MKLGSRIFLLCLSGLGLVALVAMALQAYRRLPPPIPLPDGTTLHFKAASYGTNSIFRTEPELKTRLRRWIPDRLHSLLGPPGFIMSGNGAEDETRFCFIRTTPTPGGRVGGSCQGAVILGGAEEVYQSGSQGTMTMPQSTIAELFYVAFRNFPRRDPTVRLKLTMPGGPVEMTVPNPYAGRSFPSWTAETLPQRVTTNGITFTVESVGYRSISNRPPFVEIIHSVQRNGQRCDGEWNVTWQLEDPTGNVTYSHLPLPPGEPVWKLLGSFIPNASAALEGSEVRQLGQFSPPKPGEITELSAAPLNDLGGIYAAFAGPGEYSLRDGTVLKAGPRSNSGPESHAGELSDKSWACRFGSDHARLFLVARGIEGSSTLLKMGSPIDRHLIVRFQGTSSKRRPGTFHEAGLALSGRILTRLLIWDLDLNQTPEGGQLQLIPIESTEIPFLVEAPPPFQRAASSNRSGAASPTSQPPQP